MLVLLTFNIKLDILKPLNNNPDKYNNNSIKEIYISSIDFINCI